MYLLPTVNIKQKIFSNLIITENAYSLCPYHTTICCKCVLVTKENSCISSFSIISSHGIVIYVM